MRLSKEEMSQLYDKRPKPKKAKTRQKTTAAPKKTTPTAVKPKGGAKEKGKKAVDAPTGNGTVLTEREQERASVAKQLKRKRADLDRLADEVTALEEREEFLSRPPKKMKVKYTPKPAAKKSAKKAPKAASKTK